AHLGASLAQSANEIEALIGGDAAGHDQQNAPALERQRILRFGRKACRRNSIGTVVSKVAQDVPKLTVVLRDANEHDLASWSFTVTDERLLPGASVPFRTSVAEPE